MRGSSTLEASTGTGTAAAAAIHVLLPLLTALHTRLLRKSRRRLGVAMSEGAGVASLSEPAAEGKVAAAALVSCRSSGAAWMQGTGRDNSQHHWLAPPPNCPDSDQSSELTLLGLAVGGAGCGLHGARLAGGLCHILHLQVVLHLALHHPDLRQQTGSAGGPKGSRKGWRWLQQAVV